MTRYRARTAAVVVACATSTVAAGLADVATTPTAADAGVRLIVEEASPASTAAEAAVGSLGGRVVSSLSIVGGFVADVPAGTVDDLRRSPAVARATPDGAVHMSDDDEGLEPYDLLPPNRVWQRAIGLPALPPGIDGSGVTVAVLDTGITRSADFGGRVLARADLTPGGDGYDGYGHGTHMAGIVGGDGGRSAGKWRGVAPGVTLLPIKVASWNGATDVSVVLAAMEWIAVHRDQYGIDVLSLSFGTDSSQAYALDPLNLAVERLWNAGVVVVAAAGNRGEGGSKIDKPGDDPLVVTVGAADLHGTRTTADDTVAEFSSRGPTHDGVAKPDLVAPGITVVAPRAPGSTIDAMRSEARLGKHYFKGTGTSQATAMVAGVAALVLEAAPTLTPDQVKAVLLETATTMNEEPTTGAGAGLVHAHRAVALARSTPPNPGPPAAAPSRGNGSIDSSRGGMKPYSDLDGDGVPEQVSGEIDALGAPFDAESWAALGWSDASWAASSWSSLTNVSPGWASTPWPLNPWPGLGWDGDSWSAKSWRDAGWDPGNWVAKSWRSEGWN